MAAACCAAEACSSGKFSVTIFVDDEISATRYTVCELPAGYAKDESGKEYSLSVRVKDSSGNETAVSGNMFYVEDTAYTAEYYVVGGKESKIVPVVVAESDGKSYLIDGVTEYWFEPGELALADIAAPVVDERGETIAPERLSVKVYDGDGEEVPVENGVLDLALGSYDVRYACDSVETVNAITLRVSEKRYNDGKLVYSDFSDENQAALFSTDFAAKIQSGQLVKEWTIAREKWEVIFVSDGFADFSEGGTVSFDSCLMYENLDLKVNYYPADGSAPVTIGDFYNLRWYEVKHLSFSVPAGGTLEGAKLEFVLPAAGAYGHAVSDFEIDTSYGTGAKTLAVTEPTAAYDVSAAGFAVTTPVGAEITEGLSFTVFGADGVEIVPVNGLYDLSEKGMYTVKVVYDGQEIAETYTIYVREPSYDDEDRLIYMDDLAVNENDKAMVTPDFSSATIGTALGGYGSAEKGWSKPWTPAFASWGYTFNADVDTSSGAVVSFDSCLTAWTSDTCTVTLTRADGTSEIVGSHSADYNRHTCSFTLAAGESLAGCKLTFSCTNSAVGHVFGNIVIGGSMTTGDKTSVFTLPTNAYDLADAGFSVVTLEGETVSEGVTFAVYGEDGVEILPENGLYDLGEEGLYTVRAFYEGKMIYEKYEIYVKNFAYDDQGRLIYMDITANENDKLLVTPDFAGAKVGSSLGGYGSAEKGWQKAYNLSPAISAWGYIFNADIENENGAVVYFDACLCAWDSNYCNITLTRADGSEELLAKQPADYNRHTYSFKLAAGEKLAGCKLTFNCSHNGITHVFGNIVIDTALRAASAFAVVPPSAAYDLADAGFTVAMPSGETIADGVVWTVKNAEGETLLPVNGLYDVSAAGVYTVSAAVGGQNVFGTYTLYVKEFSYDGDGRLIYMDDFAVNENDKWMVTPDFSSATISNGLGGDGSAEKGWCKPWTPAIASWGYTFNADVDTSSGAVVSFDSCLTAWTSDTCTVTLTRADGTSEIVGSHSADYNRHTYSFTLEAGESLAGCKLTFSCTNSAVGHVFGKIMIEYL